MDASAYFRGKKITVMGLGLLGRGVGDARYLAECGAELIVTDLKTREQLKESVEKLSGFSNITFVLGEHRLEDFRGRDMILKAAGVPLNSSFIAEAESQGISVRMSADLLMELADVPVIGVTGTRGKSTTTHMIYAGLHSAGQKVLLGGNIRGVSNLSLLPEVTPDHTLVLELDSWQCQGLGEAGISPNISVFTTFFQDHQNYYAENPDAYLLDKANIFLNQSPEDTLVLGKQCATSLIDTFGEHIVSRVIIAGAETLPASWTLRVPGEHNRYNAALAYRALRAHGIGEEVCKTALEGFTGVDGRLQEIKTVRGVRIFNDTTATTPEATIAALAALDTEGEKNVVLIMGGADKQLPMDALLAAVAKHAKHVCLLAGTGTDRIKDSLPNAVVYDSLAEAVAAGMEAAENGDVLVLSPAFASFGMFTNEYDRGDQFNALVAALS